MLVSKLQDVFAFTLSTILIDLASVQSLAGTMNKQEFMKDILNDTFPGHLRTLQHSSIDILSPQK